MTYAESGITEVRQFLEEQYSINTNSNKPTLKNMFTKQYRLRLRAVLFYSFFQTVGGIDYFTFYTVEIFDEIGQSGRTANLASNLGA